MTEPSDPDEAHAQDDDRYRSYEAGDGSFVLYDDENDHAWIQSERTIDLRR